jgi:uncharacterized oligopeptide transporter (OPT) family protein
MPPAGRPAPELTPRALAAGLLVGALLCVANLYMGLKTGIVESGHVTASVLAFALASGRLSRLENNVAQTAAVAAGAIPATAGLLGAVPALALLGHPVPGWGIALWGLALALLGILFGALLRRRLLDEEQLPFPTSVATAEVIEVLHGGGEAARRRTRPLLWGGALGAAVEWFREGRPSLLPGALRVPGEIAGVPVSTLGIGVSTSPLLWGVGMLVGLRVALSMLLGSMLAWGVLGPWLVRGPLQVAAERGAIWNWLSWPGTALLVGAALVALLQQVGAFAGALRVLGTVARREYRAGLLGTPAVAALLAAVVGVGRWVFDLSLAQSALALAASAVGATVCARAAGLTDIAPVGPMGQAMQAAAGGLAPGNPAINVAAGSIVAGSATQATGLLWSLGAGRPLGASPRKQIVAAILGAAVGAAICAPVYLFLVRTHGLGSAQLPMPTGVQWKAMAEVVAGGLSALPAGALPAVIAGGIAGIVLAAAGSTRAGPRLPSAMAVGIGVLVPIDYALAIVCGALLARFVQPLRERAASGGAGLVAGDSVVGLLVALLTSMRLL